MLDENLHFPKKEGQDYPPLPKGIYQAELLSVKAVQNETYDSKTKNKDPKEYQTDLVYQFTLLSGKDKDGKDLRGRNVWENFGQSFLYIGKNGKNNLYRIVEAYLGRELTREEEANGIGAAVINSFVGKQIMLSIEPKTTKQGKTFDRIADYFHAQSALPRLTDEEKEKARVKDKDENQAINVENVDFGPDPSDEGIPAMPY
jgi:hypothetical protein